MGVSYSGKRGWSQGLLVTLAIGLHNIPEGLATSTVLITKGVPIQRAVFWNFVTAIPQAIVNDLSYCPVRSMFSVVCSSSFSVC